MRMAVGRLPAGHDPCHNHPVILQSCMVTEVAIVPIQVRCPKRLRIARRVALLDLARIKRGWLRCGHGLLYPKHRRCDHTVSCCCRGCTERPERVVEVSYVEWMLDRLPRVR